MADREDYLWRRLLDPRSGPVIGYLFGSVGDADGYVLAQRQGDTLVCLDLQARGAAVEAALAFLGGLRSTIETVRWNSSGFDPLLARLPDKTFKMQVRRHWMTRIVDVARALQMRGYAVGESAELHLDVEGDDLFEDNNGRFVLTVRDGRARSSGAARATSASPSGPWRRSTPAS